jgi:acetylornithine/succinyldiaminopimelate/putrescine aminotransferase
MCEADGRTPNRKLADRMFQIGLDGNLDLPAGLSGLVLDIGGYFKNVITLAPSLEISNDEIDLAIAALDLVIRKAKVA